MYFSEIYFNCTKVAYIDRNVYSKYIWPIMIDLVGRDKLKSIIKYSKYFWLVLVYYFV